MSEIDCLLQETSRTFALSIPLLPEPLRREVSVAYLLFRIADTLEDETAIAAADRAAALDLVASAAKQPETFTQTIGAVLAAMNVPTDHDGYARLMRHTGFVLEAFDELSEHSKLLIAAHLSKTCHGMAVYVGGGAVPSTIDDLRAYCYTVAGIVGDLLTGLFAAASPVNTDQRDRLVELAPLFGEALQLVNILRDEHDDAACERRYLPTGTEREELIALAASDLHAAAAYVGILESADADPGTVAFNGINAMLAVETLVLVRADGPGMKVGRDRVRALFEKVHIEAAARDRRVSTMIRDRLDASGLASMTGVFAARKSE